ncbi:MAG: B-box zinc finger protein [Candidatus Hodarchaeota archaeon]
MSRQSKSNGLHVCKYHDDRRAIVKCDECKQLVCDECVFEWSKFLFTENARVLLGGGGYQPDHWQKKKVCPHCFVRAYLHPSKKERERYHVIRGFLSGKSREFQRAKLIVNNWEQRMLAKEREIRMLCRECEKDWHSSKYETCFKCASKKQPELLENYRREFEHPWCKKEFRIYGDPREEYLRMPKNPGAICAFFRCIDSSKCDVRFTHDPNTRITYFNRGGEYSMPTAFVLIRPKKNDAGATERILKALRTSDAVKEAYRISENYTHIPRGYTVMAIVEANTMKELKSFLYLDLKYKIANWIESNPDALIWPPS